MSKNIPFDVFLAKDYTIVNSLQRGEGRDAANLPNHGAFGGLCRGFTRGAAPATLFS
ncbi:hypothetical protein [Oceanicola sp. D3]|uniref:hypothetical protein n=1 Tax=Oceanicola sp. D3 TaxID=2587163 RepID=UPI00143DC122|nr:hypothetical protein [Oceanicola sp. D3]